MRKPCLIKVNCAGEKVFFNPDYIEALLPGTFRNESEELTVIRLNSGQELMIERPLNELLSLIAEATKPEDEV